MKNCDTQPIADVMDSAIERLQELKELKELIKKGKSNAERYREMKVVLMQIHSDLINCNKGKIGWLDYSYIKKIEKLGIIKTKEAQSTPVFNSILNKNIL